MTWFTSLLFGHIALAIVWIGGGLMIQFLALRAMCVGAHRLADLGADAEWVGTRVLAPSSLLAFVSGILLVVEGPFIAWRSLAGRRPGAEAPAGAGSER